MRIIKLMAALAISVCAIAAERQQIKIQVVDAASGVRQYSYETPGTASQSSTNCNGNATATAVGSTATANGTTNCTTTTTPGMTPRQHLISVAQIHVKVIMPTGRHVTLWCQAGFRKCGKLNPGFYSAEMEGNSVWVKVIGDLAGNEREVKYKYAGEW